MKLAFTIVAIVATLGAIEVLKPADEFPPRSSPKDSLTQQEIENKRFVQEKEQICKESKCAECGYFYQMLGGQIGYSETLCESDYRRKHDDVEIRKKYSQP